MDDGEWEQSDNDQTSYSEDSGSGRRDKVKSLVFVGNFFCKATAYVSKVYELLMHSF